MQHHWSCQSALPTEACADCKPHHRASRFDWPAIAAALAAPREPAVQSSRHQPDYAGQSKTSRLHYAESPVFCTGSYPCLILLHSISTRKDVAASNVQCVQTFTLCWVVIELSACHQTVILAQQNRTFRASKLTLWQFWQPSLEATICQQTLLLLAGRTAAAADVVPSEFGQDAA